MIYLVYKINENEKYNESILSVKVILLQTLKLSVTKNLNFQLSTHT